MIERPLYTGLWNELAAEKPMIFMAGPRQAGKTTLAKRWADDCVNRVYFNWDEPGARARLVRNPAFFTHLERRDPGPPLVVFDEIHKYGRWKSYLKGIYDRYHGAYRFLVTGSGRLDLYQRGGDSLAGRYRLFHLWPFTLAELGWNAGATEEGFRRRPARPAPNDDRHEAIWKRLLTTSGFPDPYLAGKEASWRRWSAGYGARMIREDIRDLTAVRLVQEMATLYDLLPERVGSPLSLNALAEDLHVSHHTVQAWMETFDRFYLTFRIRPWTRGVARSIRKEAKAYLFDVPLVPEPAARLENAVALELFAWTHRMNDRGLGPYGLFYVRDREKREVDFLLTRQRRPELLVEVKAAESAPTAALRRFQALWRIPAVQILGAGEGYRLFEGSAAPILIAPAWRWLPNLP